MCVQEGPAAREAGQGTGIGTASKRTAESVGAADALMDALELAAHEAARMQVLCPSTAVFYRPGRLVHQGG